MKIVIVHYHLRPGGVTSVIRQQVQILATLLPESEIVVCVGGSDRSFQSLPCRLVVDPILDYFVPQDVDSARDREAAILKLFLSQIDTEPTLFHFHNHSLGKNPCLTGAIHLLAQRADQIILFCHDFSEDRPVNQKINDQYAQWCNLTIEQFLYPDRPTIHYCTINSFDLNRLRLHQFSQSSTSLIPSPVQKASMKTVDRSAIADKLSLDRSKEWWFYPVRGIERKNIGEFILLSLLDEHHHEWLLARRPANETEIPHYESWVKCAHDVGCSVKFDVAESIDFSNIMNVSDRIVTTSIREGFGMAYLEPWLAGKPVVGREIPMVVSDMRRAGVIMDSLYTELPVFYENNWFDFALLSPIQQQEYVRTIAHDSELRNKIRQNGVWWNTICSAVGKTVILVNQEVINKEFSTEAFGKRLVKLYLEL